MGAGTLELRVDVVFLEWLEQTALATWVGESLYGYPFLLGMHVVGLALVVGLSTIVNLRLLLLITDISVAALCSVMRVAWMGFAINAVSGLALFSSQATYFITNTPFLCKIALITCGVSGMAWIQRRLRSGMDVGRPAAFASLLCWLGAIVSGRLIAYL